MSLLFVPLIAMLVAVLLEGLWLRGRGPYCWRDTIFNLNSGHLLMWLFRGLEVGIFVWVSRNASFHWLEGWPMWGVVAFCFFGWDFCFYWLHRMHHRWAFMWAIHEVHHQGEYFNTSLGVRNSWYSSLASIPFFLPLAVIGVPAEVFLVVSTFHYSVQFFNHNGVTPRLGVLEQWLVTPTHHRVHHGCNADYRDKNFGGTLLLWDRLFGTFQKELKDVPIVLGVQGAQRSLNPFWASNLPFIRWLGLREPRVEGLPVTGKVSDIYIASGGVLVFASAIYYVFHENTWSQPAGTIWLVGSFAMTLAIGGMSDGRRWGLRMWRVLALAMPCIFIFLLPVKEAAVRLLLLAFIGHVLLGFHRVKR
ncbi:sterol desaturase family protein [Stenotrophomonas bentonitica]